MLGRFFRGGGEVWPEFFFRGGKSKLVYFFRGDSIPGRFFRGEVLCGGKLYATTVALRYCKQINNDRYQYNTHPVVSPANDRSIKFTGAYNSTTL